MSFQNFWKTLHQFRMEHEHQEQTNVGEVLRRAKNPTCRISPVITSNFLIGLKQKQWRPVHVWEIMLWKI